MMQHDVTYHSVAALEFISIPACRIFNVFFIKIDIILLWPWYFYCDNCFKLNCSEQNLLLLAGKSGQFSLPTDDFFSIVCSVAQI